MKENTENVNLNEYRNVRIPLATTRPSLYVKMIVIGLIVLYIMLVTSYFTNGFLTNYFYLELGIILGLLGIGTQVYDVVYRKSLEKIIDSQEVSVVIGFSNKVLILQGEEVIEEIETDEIKVREVTEEEDETFFGKYVSVIDCFKNNEHIESIGICKEAKLEGQTLKADMSRADEDIQVIYDEDDLDDDENDEMFDEDSEYEE